MPIKNSSKISADYGVIALQLIAFIVSDNERLDRFAALSGMGLNDLQEGAQNQTFLGFMFDYALQDEELILEFAREYEIPPQALINARRHFPGANDDF
jgi:Protein of unknown function (DUF3572)